MIKTKNSKEFKLYYHLEDNGDGSASVEFHQTQEEADKAGDEAEGWGENCASYVELKIEKGKIYFKTATHDENGKWVSLWKELGS